MLLYEDLLSKYKGAKKKTVVHVTYIIWKIGQFRQKLRAYTRGMALIP